MGLSKEISSSEVLQKGRVQSLDDSGGMGVDDVASSPILFAAEMLDPGDSEMVPSLHGKFWAAPNESGPVVGVDSLDPGIHGPDPLFIHLRCRYPNEDWFCVTALYAIPDNSHKQSLWSQLGGIAASMDIAWSVIGDFNDIATLDERTGGSSGCSLRCSLFTDRLQACNLMDEVEAPRRVVVSDSVGIDLVPYSPLVLKGDFHDQPFKNEMFDFEFSNMFDHVLYPEKFVGEIERTLKRGGCVLHVTLSRRPDKYSANDLYSVTPLKNLFRMSELVHAREVDAFGLDTQFVDLEEDLE
ncbi:hypothetical protein K1719_041588 [Acacia pycnantha]|nr:hypothetical protein K1719_041588 [Acacia pycnantha]